MNSFIIGPTENVPTNDGLSAISATSHLLFEKEIVIEFKKIFQYSSEVD